MVEEGATDGAEQHDDESNEPVSVASLVIGIIGLFIGIITIYGPRGVVLALGLVALILGGTGLRRATSTQERGTAYGGIALGALTLLVGILVLGRG